MQIDRDDIRISDLRPGMKHVDVSFKVLDKSEPRVVRSKRGSKRENYVADVTVGDESGTVILPLWNDMIDRVKLGRSYQLENGYTGFFHGSLRLKIGRQSRLNEIDEDIDDVNLDLNISRTSKQYHYYQGY